MRESGEAAALLQARARLGKVCGVGPTHSPGGVIQLPGPDARDLGVTEKGQKQKKIWNEVKSVFSLP